MYSTIEQSKPTDEDTASFSSEILADSQDADDEYNEQEFMKRYRELVDIYSKP